MGSNGERNLEIGNDDEMEPVDIDPKRSRFPHCIVWSPLPVLSCFFPCIGHIGICREDGVILDFVGPNFVCVDEFTFGAPTRYIQLSKEQCCTLLNSGEHDSDNEMDDDDETKIVRWDDALRKSTREYQHHTYNILTRNCHSFVANCLNRLKFQAGGWNVVNLAVLMFINGRFVSKLAALKTYLPFILVFSLGFGLGGESFLSYLAIFIFALIGWFVLGTYCLRNAIRV